MFDTTGKIAIAQLAFFIIAIPLTLYCLFKHGKHGLLGWFFISLFCIIRIVGAALIISNESANKPLSTAGLIISSVAIAPLIISVGGIAHESYGVTYSLEYLSPHKLTTYLDTSPLSRAGVLFSDFFLTSSFTLVVLEQSF